MTGSDVTEWIIRGGIVPAVAAVIVAGFTFARHLVSWYFILKALPCLNHEEGFQIKSGSVTVDQHGTKNPDEPLSVDVQPEAVPPRLSRPRRKASLPASAAPGPPPSPHPPSSPGLPP